MVSNAFAGHTYMYQFVPRQESTLLRGFRRKSGIPEDTPVGEKSGCKMDRLPRNEMRTNCRRGPLRTFGDLVPCRESKQLNFMFAKPSRLAKF